ncbi:MAG: hypothetical protein Q8Q49_02930 [bacterium]|nr:hypothetical protein [bacterium]
MADIERFDRPSGGSGDEIPLITLRIRLPGLGKNLRLAPDILSTSEEFNSIDSESPAELDVRSQSDLDQGQTSGSPDIIHLPPEPGNS